MFVVKLILWFLTAFCWWKVFEKAKIKGWKAFIPFYCDYTRFKLAEKNVLYIPFLLFSIIEGVLNLVYSALAVLDLADTIFNEIDLGLDLQFLFWCRMFFTILVLAIEIMIGILISRKFGKEPIFGVGLGILPFVFAPVLAFDYSKYIDTKQI